ncbi:PucR family transcriptional regulator [Nocardiaceae bacterium YC2-7]|uniref:PucR family transcriptional regulator n=2 Tax=Antrihabitans stalactiti TaxID=2584121 RepID=A0A848KBK6_9NOCA|nr:PucR family transcriptional regulator [Antrihabitans stalactiti]
MRAMEDRPMTPAPFVATASRVLLEEIDNLTDEIAREVVRREPAYGNLSPAAQQDIRNVSRDNMIAILGALSGEPASGDAIARATGKLRAEQGVPLPAVLRAFRIGTTVVWDRLILAADNPADSRDLLLTASDIWNVVDDFSQGITAAYQETTTEQMRRDAHARDAALDVLLSGRIVDGPELWESANVLRLPHHATYCVVVAMSGTPAGETLPGVSDSLATVGVRSAWRVELDSQVGVVALTPRFDVERLAACAAERTLGRVGVSVPYDNLEETAAARRQAQLACAAGKPGSREVVQYDKAPVAILLAGAPEVSGSLIASVLGPILALPEHERDILLETMRTWFASGGDPSATAAALYCHRNTVRQRLNRVAQLTGHDLTSPTAAIEVYLALEAHRIAP